MDTQNDGLEKVDSLKIWPFLVFMLDFWGRFYISKSLASDSGDEIETISINHINPKLDVFPDAIFWAGQKRPPPEKSHQSSQPFTEKTCREHAGNYIHGNLRYPPQSYPPQEIAGLIKGLWKTIGFPW